MVQTVEKQDYKMLMHLDVQEVKNLIEDVVIASSKDNLNISEQLAILFLYLANDDFLKGTKMFSEDIESHTNSRIRATKRINLTIDDVREISSGTRMEYLEAMKEITFDLYQQMPKSVETIASTVFDDMYDMFYEIYQ